MRITAEKDNGPNRSELAQTIAIPGLTAKKIFLCVCLMPQANPSQSSNQKTLGKILRKLLKESIGRKTLQRYRTPILNKTRLAKINQSQCPRRRVDLKGDNITLKR